MDKDGGRTPYERLMDRAAEAYEAENYDQYEELLDRGAAMAGKPSWQVEDDVTDRRLGLGD